MADAALHPTSPAAFRTIGELAERCGHYCWIEHRLFVLAGTWASAALSEPEPRPEPGPGSEPGPRRVAAAELRVVCNAMSLWHAFVAGAWRDRLPVRAGVDPGGLIVPPPGPVGEAFDLLAAEVDAPGALGATGAQRGMWGAFGGLVEHVLPALLAAYDEDAARAAAVSEAPVGALLGLVRPRVHREIERGRALLERGPATGEGPAQKEDEGVQMATDLTAHLQRVLSGGRGIFPAARAS